jgi:hypothetical protein
MLFVFNATGAAFRFASSGRTTAYRALLFSLCLCLYLLRFEARAVLLRRGHRPREWYLHGAA